MSEKKQRILVVEDDEAILLGLEENLKYAGYDVLTAADGPQALKAGLEAQPDLVLLDIMLPGGLSGYEVCRRLRDGGMRMPIVMLTARQDDFDKVHGFEMGADDYVTKPFSVAELLARIRAILLRGERRSGGPRSYEFGGFLLDLDARVLRRKARARAGKPGRKEPARPPGGAGSEEDGEEVPLTRTEFDLLTYFCANEGKALTREVLMRDVWDSQYFGTQRSLDSFVASLRAKIEKEPSDPQHILTLHGVGYKFAR
jgi:DNA-binding response OmpR family regulator